MRLGRGIRKHFIFVETVVVNGIVNRGCLLKVGKVANREDSRGISDPYN